MAAAVKPTWRRESREQMDASEESVQGSRQRAAETGGGGVQSVERFEVAVDTQV